MASIFTRQGTLSKEDREFYKNSMATFKPKLQPTGELIKEEYEDGSSITRVIAKGSWTPYGVMRDCGTHYIVARHSRYDKISKDLQTVEFDVEDY